MRTFIENRITDLRYAGRAMRKSPGFFGVAALSLALGIGANAAIFTLVDAVLLRWLPVKAADQLYVLAYGPPRMATSWMYPDYEATRDRNHGFSGLIAYNSPGAMGFSAQGEPVERQGSPANGIFVSGNYFQTLGVEPAAGRVLNADDDKREGASPYVVLSYDFWQRRFGGGKAVGKAVRVNGEPMEIVGIAQRGFAGVEVGVNPDFFMPILMRTAVQHRGGWNNRHNSWLTLMGRLKPGTDIRQLEAELSVIYKQQEDDDRRTAPDPRFVNSASPVRLLRGAQGYSRLRATLEKPLVVLMWVVGLVLLIACANLANLLLARAASRRREIAVRLAVGATRRRLVGQLLTESILLSVIGGVAGLIVSALSMRALVGLIPYRGATAVSLSLSPDMRLLAFTFVVSVLTGLMFGLAPAIQAARTDFAPTLKDDGSMGSGAGRFNIRKALVAVQVALSLLLLIGSGLFLRTLRNLRDLDPGFRPENVLVVDVAPARNGYQPQRVRDYYERLRDAVASGPGMRSVSLASITPLSGSRWNDSVNVEGYQWKPGEQPYIDMNAVSPRFFETMGIPIVFGRDFRAEDVPASMPKPGDWTGPRVLIVNESFANHFFPEQNPIGRRLCLNERYKPEQAFEIVGVVKDVRYFGLRSTTESMIYMPAFRNGGVFLSLCVRTSNDPRQAIEQVRREIAAQDPAVPMLGARTMEQQLDSNIVQEKLIATLSSFFGVLALLLAAVGLYGVMAHSVSRRTREIGIRMALGAKQSSVLWLVLRDAGLMVLVGAAIGVPVALGLTRFVSSFLYGVSQHDPVSLILATAALGIVAALASYLPARRASRVDPIRALRYE